MQFLDKHASFHTQKVQLWQWQVYFGPKEAQMQVFTFKVFTEFGIEF